jgi:K319-like protein
LDRFSYLIVIIPFLFLLVPYHVYGLQDLGNFTSFDPFSGFDGRIEGKSVGHFEYEKNCSKNIDDWELCKLVIDNEILLRGNLLNVDKNTLNASEYHFIPTPTGSAWGACFGTIQYYDIKTDKLISSYPFSAPVVFGPADFGISSSGSIFTTKNFENISVGFSTSDPVMKQCIGEIRGNIDLRTFDKNIYSSRDSGIINKTNGHIEYSWIVTLLHSNINNNPIKNNLTPQNKIGNDIFLIFQTSEEPIPNRNPLARIQVTPSTIVESQTRVKLEGSQSSDPDPGDSIIKYEWRPVGNNIVLNKISPTAVDFVAPDVTQPTIFTFSLTVFDTFQAQSSTIVHVTVNPKTNKPPFAVAASIPDKVVMVEQPIMLDGRKSFDPDPQDHIIDYLWSQTDTGPHRINFMSPGTSTVTFDAPYYVPTKFTSLNTPPQIIPLEFSLKVVDNHGLKSINDASVKLNVECNSQDRTNAENGRLFFNKLITFPGGSLKSPQTVENFQYFVSGKGDLIPNKVGSAFIGVTGMGTAKPLPKLWLEHTVEFRKAQINMANDISKDISLLLNQMNNGETRSLVKVYSYNIDDSRKIYYWTPVGNIPSDFTTAVGAANTFAHTNLVITKASGFFSISKVSGEIKLELKDTYDFNPTRKFFGAGPLGVVKIEEIYSFIKCLGARNFNQDTMYIKNINVPVEAFRDAFVNCEVRSENCKIK